jgi:hypothetical protein
MKALSVLVTLWFVVATPAAAQTSRIEGGSATVGDFVFYYETRLEPPTPPLGDTLNMLVLTTPPNRVHRVMLDRTRKVYFGYDARIGHGGRGAFRDGRPDERMFWFEFGPLTMTPELERIIGSDAKSWKMLPSPRFPKNPMILPGEALELPLLTNDTWGQKLIDYVTVQDPQPIRQQLENGPRQFSFAPGTPRDFTAADVELRLDQPVVRAPISRPNGNDAHPDVARWIRMGGLGNYRVAGEATGSIVWIYVPNRGRFLLSLMPRGEFRQAGTVRGTSLTFTVDGNTYGATAASTIVPGQAAFNLYVLHQPGWKPDYANANLTTVHIGAADRAEYLLGKP